MSEPTATRHNTTAKLVYMANQIATFFESQPGQPASANTAAHIKSFWTPTMLRDIYKHLDDGGAGLSAVALDSICILKAATKEVVGGKPL